MWQRIALSLGWSKWEVNIPFEDTRTQKAPKIVKPENRTRRRRKNTTGTPIN